MYHLSASGTENVHIQAHPQTSPIPRFQITLHLRTSAYAKKSWRMIRLIMSDGSQPRAQSSKVRLILLMTLQNRPRLSKGCPCVCVYECVCFQDVEDLFKITSEIWRQHDVEILKFNVLVMSNGFPFKILWRLIQVHSIAALLLDLKFPFSACEKIVLGFSSSLASYFHIMPFHCSSPVLLSLCWCPQDRWRFGGLTFLHFQHLAT